MRMWGAFLMKRAVTSSSRNLRVLYLGLACTAAVEGTMDD
jgi:hypothetical protein